MRKSLIIFFLFLFWTHSFSKTTEYDEMFQFLNASSSNIMIESLGSEDPDLVYTALKRIGQLTLTNARTKVIEAISAANPTANQGKVKRSIRNSDVFNMGVWALSKIGNEKDVNLIASFIKDAPKRENQLYLFAALGEYWQSTNALRVLHYYTEIIFDEQVLRQIINSIRMHGERSSMIYLIRLGNRPNLSDKFKKYIVETIQDLGRGRAKNKK